MSGDLLEDLMSSEGELFFCFLFLTEAIIVKFENVLIDYM